MASVDVMLYKMKGKLNQLSLCINCGNPYVIIFVLSFLQQHLGF